MDLFGVQENFEPVQIPLWIDLLAVFAGGLSGSLIAIRNRFDVAGVVVIALVSGLGGGIIRDVLIGAGPPAALRNPDYLYTALAAAAAGFLFRRFVSRINPIFVLIDAISLGLYTFVGMQKGLNFDLPLVTAALLGVITATGGGLLRDVLSGEVPNVLRPGHLSMTASIVGTLVYAILHQLGVPSSISLWFVLAVVMGLRLASEYFGWTTPEAGVAHGQIATLGGSILQAPQRIRLKRTNETASDGEVRVRRRFRLRRQPTPEGDAGEQDDIG